MSQFEYQVIPAPRRGKKARGVKGSEERFAYAMSEVLNEMAAEGWEYQRTDTLPSEERSGLRGRTTVYQNMLVFRRAVEAAETSAPEAPAFPVAAPEGVPTAEQEAEQIEEFIERFDEETHVAPSLPSAEEANVVPDSAPAVQRSDS